MSRVRTIAQYLGAFGAGVVTAGYFLSGPVVHTGENLSTSTRIWEWALIPPTAPLTEPWSSEATQESTFSNVAERSLETTGSSVADEPSGISDKRRLESQRQPEQACNVSVCRRFYQSFDEATCTYRPYGGGPPQPCNR